MSHAGSNRESQALVHREAVNWDYRHDGRVEGIPVECFKSEGEGIDPSVLSVLFLSGYGENDWAITKVIRRFGELGLGAVGVKMPFDLLPADRLAIEAACIEVPHVVGDHYKEKLGLPVETPLTAIGKSQGGGVLARSLQERQEGLGSLGFIGPACMNLERSCSMSEKQRRWQFYRRFGLNALLQSPADPVNLISVATIGRQLVYDTFTRRFVPKVGLALMTSLNQAVLDHVERGNQVVYVVGAKDRVFRNADVKAAFRSYEPDEQRWPQIVEIPGTSHVASASRKGIAELGITLKHLGLIEPAQVPEGTREISPPEETAD
jgi:hypothetical protein